MFKKETLAIGFFALVFAGSLQAQTLKGAFVMHPESVVEMANAINATAYGAGVKTKQDIKDYLAVSNGIVPVLSIRHFVQRQSDGYYDIDKANDIVDAVIESGYEGRIIWMWDEPMWMTLERCIAGSADHCEDVSNDYQRTLSEVEQIDGILNGALGTESYHVESYAVIIERVKHAGKPMVMSKTAKHLSMNCYDGFEKCGFGVPSNGQMSIAEYNAHVYDFLIMAESDNPIGRSLSVVPGSYTDENVTQWQSIEYMAKYKQLMDTHNNIQIGIIGFFLWDDLGPHSGAKHNQMLIEAMKRF